MLEAGFACVDFTPSVPIPLAGYFGLGERLSDHVRDPLKVRALALKQKQRRVVLVAFDLLMVTEELSRQLERRVSDLGIKVIVHATHSHSALGGFVDSWVGHRALGRYRRWSLLHLLHHGEKAIREALGDLRPATVHAAVERIPKLAINRRDSEGPVDDQFVGLKIVRDRDEGWLVSFPGHPVIVAERDPKAVSADFPGEVLRRIEASGISFAMYVQGALGGVDVWFPDTPITVEDNLDQQAAPIVEAAQTCLANAQTDELELVWSERELLLPPCDSRPFFEDQWLARLLDFPLRYLVNMLFTGSQSDRLTMKGFRLGNFCLLGTPADLGVSIALALKDMAYCQDVDCAIAASQCDGYAGYLHFPDEYRQAPSKETRDMAVYENAMSMYGRKMGLRVFETACGVFEGLVR